MEKKCPDVVKKSINQEDMDLQLTPPQMHRRNLTEQAMQTGNWSRVCACGAEMHTR